MGKALIVVAETSEALASGNELAVIGGQSVNATEGNTQISCTEGATFSNLRMNVTAGNSGTATFRFRDAGANGQQVLSFTGTGINEDATNTDVLTAGDLFNYSYVDTGTNATWRWVTMNVTLASGHGSIHGADSATPRILDVTSSTRFIPLSGRIETDASATEDPTEWKVRGYDSIASMQVKVTANARVNDSIFRNRINGADGTGVVTFVSSATGIIEDTAINDSLAAGDTINASVTLNTGVEDLSLAAVAAVLKSTGNHSEAWTANANGIARAASATAHYAPIGGWFDSITLWDEAAARIRPGFAGTASNLRCYLSANTYTSNGTLKLMQNTSSVITTTLTASGGAGWYENTSDTVSFDADDEFSLEFDEGGTGSATITAAGLTFQAAGGAAAQMFTHFQARTDGLGHGGIFPGNRVLQKLDYKV